MKTILIPTDFSENAAHAAEYGYQLAKQIKSDIILCNAFAVPAEMPEAGMIAWPMYEYDEIVESCAAEVKALKEDLEKSNTEGFHPEIKCMNEVGALQDVIVEMVHKYDIGLIVMGIHGANGMSGLMLGNHSRRMIDSTTKPLLLIPPNVKGMPVKKIAFATDLENITKDLGPIYALIAYAKLLNAEILLTYVDDGKYHTPEFIKHMNVISNTLSDKAGYSLISYRVIQSHSAESGLDWFCRYGQIDMLVMVHRRHNFFDTLLHGSHTKKMADQIKIPLMVIPENFHQL